MNNLNNLAYGLYMAEAEKQFPHPIESICRDFRAIYNSGRNPQFYIDSVLAKYGLHESDLSDAECRRISRAIR